MMKYIIILLHARTVRCLLTRKPVNLYHHIQYQNNAGARFRLTYSAPCLQKKHIVDVQDLASRFPAGKIVASTKASSVLPALSDIYNNFGNPGRWLNFAKRRTYKWRKFHLYILRLIQ